MCIHAGAWFSFCLSARVLNSNLNLNSNSFELRGKRKVEEKGKRAKQERWAGAAGLEAGFLG